MDDLKVEVLFENGAYYEVSVFRGVAERLGTRAFLAVVASARAFIRLWSPTPPVFPVTLAAARGSPETPKSDVLRPLCASPACSRCPSSSFALGNPSFRLLLPLVSPPPPPHLPFATPYPDPTPLVAVVFFSPIASVHVSVATRLYGQFGFYASINWSCILSVR